MNRDNPISTPTVSSNPSPQSTSTPQPTFTQPTFTSPPDTTGAGGFEINLGPVTLTDLDFSNRLHLAFLAGLLGVLAASLLYRDYVRRRQKHFDEQAYQKAEATFGVTIDRLKKRKPIRISVLDYFLHPDKVREHHELMEDFKLLREQLHAFENEFGGQINAELEKAIYHLLEVTATESPNIEAIVTALQGIHSVAKRLNLSAESIHTVNSISFQLRRAKPNH